MKNIYYILSIITISLILACSNTTKNQETSVAVENNTLTEKETAEGWRLLFDGKTSDGGRGYKKETFPTDWNITDEGEIYMSASGRGEAGSANGGDIIYDQKFSNFHVKLEWKVSEGGNSGIFYLGQETPEFDYIWRTAPEMQILDNDRHPDAFLGKDWRDKLGPGHPVNRAEGGITDLNMPNGGASNGPGTGTSDDIPAMLSDGEFVVTSNAVKNLGGGDRMVGAQRMYRLMNQLDPNSQTPAEMSGVGYA